VGLLERIAAARGRDETRYSADQWLTEYLLPTTFGYGGNQYAVGGGYNLVQTLAGNRASEIVATLPGYTAALRGCPPAFAAQLIRALVLSQARFTFRRLPSSPKARSTFGNRDLGPLERPWTGATTGELIARMEWHAGLAGNAFVVRRPNNRLRVLRPDWVAILYGSQQEPDDAAHALDGELIGYVYQNGGLRSSGNQPTTLLPADVAHWSPIPDPEAGGVGMSWITPAIRDMQGDRLAAEHKIRYFENGATPNLVVKGIPAATKTQFDDLVAMMEEKHSGVANAYRTLYLTAGADATVVGSNLAELDLKGVQGANETRIAFLSRVHPVILGIAEGLAGSSLNAGNFGMARRIWADTWIYPSLQDLAASLATIINVPSDAELWFDTADMPILREDAKDAADIEQIKATTITQYVREGFAPDSSIAAVVGQNVQLLKHSGNMSVQLQPPGSGGEDTELKKQTAEAQLLNAQLSAVKTGIDAGFEPTSVVEAVEAGDLSLMRHTGQAAPAPGAPAGQAADPMTAGGRQADLDWGLFGGEKPAAPQPPGGALEPS
jgi:phage portal protein BeeE